MISAEDTENQVVMCSMDTSKLLSLATPVIAQQAHEQNKHGRKDGGYVGLLLTKADLAAADATCL
jgi:hypothetical protein